MYIFGKSQRYESNWVNCTRCWSYLAAGLRADQTGSSDTSCVAGKLPSDFVRPPAQASLWLCGLSLLTGGVSVCGVI